MKFVSAILTFLVIAFVIMMAIPVVTAGLALLLVFSGFFIWLLPILLILGSEKTSGLEKAAWILAIIFLSWFAWIFYFLLAPLKPIQRYPY